MSCKTSYGFNRSAYAGYIFHQIVTKLNFKVVERKGEQVIPIYMDKHFIQLAQSNEGVEEIYKVEIWEQVAEIFDVVEFHDALLEDCVVIIKEPEWTLALRPSIKELPQLCCRAWELDSLVLGGVVSIGCMAFARSKINTVVISEGCLHVEGEAFRAAHIRKLYLPKSLDSIDAVAFYNSPVESVFYPGSKEDFMSLCTGAQYNLGFRKQSKVTVNCNDGILELERLS